MVTPMMALQGMVELDREMIRARLREVGMREMSLSEKAADDVGFHMTDWLADLEAYQRFCATPTG